MLARTKLSFVQAYVNSFNISGKEINQYCVDFFDEDGASKSSKYRTFYCDELTYNSLGFNEPKTNKNLAGKELDFEFKSTIINKTNDKLGFSYTMDKMFLVNIFNLAPKN